MTPPPPTHTPRAQLAAKASAFEDQVKDAAGLLSSLRLERDRVIGLLNERDEYIQVRKGWPAWKSPHVRRVRSHPGTPTPSLPSLLPQSLEGEMKAAKAGQGPLRKQVQELTHSLDDLEAAARAAQDQARRDAEEVDALRKQVADRDARLRASADAQARVVDLEDQNKEDKESIMSIRRERDRLLALLEQTEARISELEAASKRDKTDNASLRKQVGVEACSRPLAAVPCRPSPHLSLSIPYQIPI